MPLVRFVNLVFRAFAPEIERLQEEKIETLARYRASRRGHNVFEDHSIEILSRVAVDVRGRAASAAPAIASSS